ncbi:hypothetical protein CURTO8I2_170034 [Curtobacterium sp. 8I-2]|nr:hypothetical protein CURTO8I2_170034 [Curtobacterium sp. 8I-2]
MDAGRRRAVSRASRISGSATGHGRPVGRPGAAPQTRHHPAGGGLRPGAAAGTGATPRR